MGGPEIVALKGILEGWKGIRPYACKCMNQSVAGSSLKTE